MYIKIPPDHVIRLTQGNPNFTKNIGNVRLSFTLRQ